MERFRVGSAPLVFVTFIGRSRPVQLAKFSSDDPVRLGHFCACRNWSFYRHFIGGLGVPRIFQRNQPAIQGCPNGLSSDENTGR